MKKLIRDFFLILPRDQISFLKEKMSLLPKTDKITFLKEILKGENPPETTTFILNQLQKLKYRDNYFYRKFFYHVDHEVVAAAKKGITHIRPLEQGTTKTLLHLFKEGKDEDREFLIDNFFQKNGRLPTDTLVALLSLDSKSTRQRVIDSITDQHEINTKELATIVVKGAVWYTRSSIVEILGKRKCEHLFDIIDELLEDQNVEVKLKLIHALAEYNRDKVKKYLHILCQDKYIWVKREAKKVLAKI